ncbi:zinc-binding dehydrogenase [bacterium]|nr:zinc-binding dehydrogenase [bacterium]MDA9901182.1 zinc-binding dehydrogenase [Gammaproteobacteria bacterium]MDB2444139.1 zinc-binding dehydrogenase [Gammaproteobacteria bacterium]MDG0997329.1 zinc-binding dehydrogenase [Gammaproteobacteria bacterium]MDG1951699.1 zinc-binding dehydrogenase [Gammaproteobacteria bacterium]|tara:strand:+ start:302 stop:1438 length:1137 start_codon:yes stop_codon:yes gene_type:complete
MSGQNSKEIRSKVTEDGEIEISIATVTKPTPGEDEVLIRVEAAPINPSDLGLLLSFAADLSTINVSGDGDQTVTSMKIHPALMNAMKPRLGQSMPVGNEGAGIIEDAGANAKELIGKTVGLAGGAMYSQYRCVPASSCLVMNDGTSSKEAASSFVNPLTALAFIETMKMEKHSAIVHTAAASNLGQMLVKICENDNIPLINIVRKSEQEKILKDLGAKYICNTSDTDFMENLIDALIETGATLGFDATGGGNNGELPGQILSAMEVAANKTAKEYSRYGSDTYKQVYIYGGLDPSPTILKRAFGMSWGLGGWLLTPMIGKIGMERFQQMRMRVAAEIKTTFASNYAAEISLEEMLQPETIKSYAKQATGEKYLVSPHK